MISSEADAGEPIIRPADDPVRRTGVVRRCRLAAGQRGAPLNEYRVRIRGTSPTREVARDAGLAAVIADAQNFGGIVEADSPKDAAESVLRKLREDRWPIIEIVYVYDSTDGIEAFWPTGMPLAYERPQGMTFREETSCFLRVSDDCVRQFEPSSADVVVVRGRADEVRYVCSPCAAVLAPESGGGADPAT
jgi:hypothetical protein